MKKSGFIVSRLDHPVIISYNGEGLLVSPREKVKVKDTSLLGALPKGISIIKE